MWTHLVCLYTPGLSHWAVKAVPAPLGLHIDHVTGWWDLQDLAMRLRGLVAVVMDLGGTVLQLVVADADFGEKVSVSTPSMNGSLTCWPMAGVSSS